MELRKATVTRVITPPETPDYNRGADYLLAHACFSRRKSFKRPDKPECDEIFCPECGGVAYRMGRNFAAPRKADIKQWEKILLLYSAGFRFFGSGKHDASKLPEKLSDVDMFIKDNPNHFLKVAAPRAVKFVREIFGVLKITHSEEY